MKTWLITHNPDNWTWPDLENKITKTHNGETVVESWTCRSKQVSVGDRVFLMRTGERGRGIVAAGHCVKDSYEAPHYDPQKASAGATSSHIDVEFDWIIDIENARYIQQDMLKEKFSEQEWSPMSSGIAINDEYSYDLELEWAKCIGIEHDVYNLLKASKDIDPDAHDGSYELVRETVRAFCALPEDYSFTFADLDLVYLMAIIFNSTERNKKAIVASSLPQNEKERLAGVMEEVWDRAQSNVYDNIAKKPISVGMFGTGFYTFNKPTSDTTLPLKVIRALVAIANAPTADDAYQYLINDYSNAIKGIAVASFSVMAHCLKPNWFPIINKNEGFGNVFSSAGVSEFKGKSIGEYAQFSKVLSEKRDKKFGFKNYRIMDLVARMIVTIDFIEALDYIEANGGKTYQKPEKASDPARATELKALRERAQKVVAEIDKMARCLEEAFGLDNKWKSSQWLDSSGTVMRKYLWIKMHYAAMPSTVDSISIFVENSMPSVLGREKPRIRLSIEMVNENADAADYAQHHKVLDRAPANGLVYVASGTGVHDIVISEDTSVIKQKLADGTYKKVINSPNILEILPRLISSIIL